MSTRDNFFGTKKTGASSNAWKKAALVLSMGLLTGACASGSTPLSIDSDAASKAPLVASADLDPFAASAISAGDWDLAVAKLEGRCGKDPLKMINLAFAYHQKGRSKEAMALYEAILDGNANPYAERHGKVQLRVKTIARMAMERISG